MEALTNLNWYLISEIAFFVVCAAVVLVAVWRYSKTRSE